MDLSFSIDHDELFGCWWVSRMNAVLDFWTVLLPKTSPYLVLPFGRCCAILSSTMSLIDGVIRGVWRFVCVISIRLALPIERYIWCYVMVLNRRTPSRYLPPVWRFHANLGSLDKHGHDCYFSLPRAIFVLIFRHHLLKADETFASLDPKLPQSLPSGINDICVKAVPLQQRHLQVWMINSCLISSVKVWKSSLRIIDQSEFLSSI